MDILRIAAIAVAILVLLVVVAIIVRPHVNRKREKMIYQMVNDITNVLGNRAYADFGTLLGAYRDDGVIKDDMDGDLAILRSDADSCLADLKEKLDKSKYTVDIDPLKIKVWIKGTSVGCDIGIYEVDPGKTTLTRQTFTIPYNKVFPLKLTHWGKENAPLYIPNDPEWYLVYEYGSTWNVPRPGDKGREAADQGKWGYSEMYAKGYKLLASLTGIPLLWK